MKLLKKIILCFVALAANSSAYPIDKHFSYVDWETGLCDQPMWYNCWFENDREIFAKFAALYEAKHPGKIEPSDELLIPKTIHQIWVGGPLPQKYKGIKQSWKRLHPNWEYKLWTDADVKDLDMQNRELYNQATNIGQKADILRCEILNQFGGVYVDMDFECLKPLDELHYLYTFYTGLNHVRTVELANGLIACAPDHPLMQRMIQNISVAKNPRRKDWRQQIIKTSGPAFFTKQFNEYLDETGDDSIIAFPSIYFYPAPGGRGNMWGEAGKKYIKPESFAIHYFGHSWWRKRR